MSYLINDYYDKYDMFVPQSKKKITPITDIINNVLLTIVSNISIRSNYV